MHSERPSDDPPMRPFRRHRALIATCLAALVILAVIHQSTPSPSQIWEPAIQEFEAQDRDVQPTPGGVVFVGSSTIRLWPLDATFPDLETVNRGFGGSQIADTLFFFDRLVTPHEPEVVVLYAGDNDITFGKSPEQVVRDFEVLTAALHSRLPDTTLVFLGIKPSTARWQHWPKMQQVNADISERCDADERLIFVDLAPAMLNEDGAPRSELLAPDGVHLSPAGYRLWTQLLQPKLDALVASDSRQKRSAP